jgi:prolyl 4-hydroxylase
MNLLLFLLLLVPTPLLATECDDTIIPAVNELVRIPRPDILYIAKNGGNVSSDDRVLMMSGRPESSRTFGTRIFEMISMLYGDIDVHGYRVMNGFGEVLDVWDQRPVWTPIVYAVPPGDHWMWPPVYLGHRVCIDTEDKEHVCLETMSVRPRVFSIESYLSEEETTAIRELGRDRTVKSRVYEATGQVESEVRTSSQAWIYPQELEAAAAVSARTASVLRMSDHLSSLFEPMQVVHYDPTQRYESHYDYFPTENYPDHPQIQARVNRYATVFYYLNEVEEGGETVFPRSDATDDSYLLGPIHNYADCTRGLRVKPRRGAAVLWYNLLPEGQMDAAFDTYSMHGGCTVTKGEKWGANHWVSNKLYRPKGEETTKRAAAEAVAEEEGSISVTIFPNGGNNSGTEPTVTVTLTPSEDPTALATLIDEAIAGLGTCMAKCGRRGVSRTPDTLRLHTVRGDPLKDTASLVDGELLFLVPEDETWVWPGVKLGHRVVVCETCGANDGPIELETLSLAPRAFRVTGIVSEEDAELITEAARPKLFKSQVIEGGREFDHPGRTSSQTWMPLKSSPAVARVEERACAAVKIPRTARYHETMQVVSYVDGQKYDAHYDTFDPKLFPDNVSVQQGRQRLLTLFFYLVEPEEGGHTVFPRADVPGSYGEDKPIYNNADCSRGLQVPPNRLSAVLWYNLDARDGAHMDGVTDVRSLHSGCPVTKGEKVGANLWFYNKNV